MRLVKGMRAKWDERNEKVAELRAQGKTWVQVGEAVGIGAQGAKQAFKRWQKTHSAETEAAERWGE